MSVPHCSVTTGKKRNVHAIRQSKWGPLDGEGSPGVYLLLCGYIFDKVSYVWQKQWLLQQSLCFANNIGHKRPGLRSSVEAEVHQHAQVLWVTVLRRPPQLVAANMNTSPSVYTCTAVSCIQVKHCRCCCQQSTNRQWQP